MVDISTEALERYRTKDFVRKDKAWLHAALMFAMDMSKDPSRKVGAAIVAPGNRMCAFGYNGLIAGMDETPENWSKPRKYDFVRHAEENALYSAPFDTRGCTLYSTLKPCHLCLGAAVNCGIRQIVFMEDPVPFELQKEEVWQEIAQLLTDIRVYARDEITHRILEWGPEKWNNR